MGIKGWYDVFGDSAVIMSEKEWKTWVSGKCIGIDASGTIFSASLGMASVRALTDKNGTPTVLLNTIMNNIVSYKKLKVKGLLFVFDNPVPNKHKAVEQAKRRTARKKAEDDLNNPENNNSAAARDKLEKRTFTITKEMIDDVKHLLELLGVAWITTPENYEAEHLGAELTIDGIIDTFITMDSDAILFGAKSMVRRVKNRQTKKIMYEEYGVDRVLNTYEMSRETMVELSVMLGCDFAEKTSGIAAKTVLVKGPSKELTENQKKAKAYFLSKCPYDASMIVKTKSSMDDAILWLSDEKGFNADRVKKILAPLY